MRYLLIVSLLLCGCFRERPDRPLFYKTKLQRAEAIYSQTERTLKQVEELSAQVLEVYKLVKELQLRSRIYESSRCACSPEVLAESP